MDEDGAGRESGEGGEEGLMKKNNDPSSDWFVAVVIWIMASLSVSTVVVLILKLLGWWKP